MSIIDVANIEYKTIYVICVTRKRRNNFAWSFKNISEPVDLGFREFFFGGNIDEYHMRGGGV